MLNLCTYISGTKKVINTYSPISDLTNNRDVYKFHCSRHAGGSTEIRSLMTVKMAYLSCV